jgi:hypothetical protein
MDGSHFDDLSRNLVRPRHRRRLLSMIGGGAVAAMAGALGLSAVAPESTEAKKKKKKKKKKNNPAPVCSEIGESCTSDNACCGSQDICDIGKNGATVCCVAFDAGVCSSDADCCGDMRCTAGSRCL